MRRSEIIAIYRQGPDAVVEVVTELSLRVDELELRIHELEARFKKDSHNSSKPPSSDKSSTGRSGRKPSNSRLPSERSPGGQKGHPGHTLLFSEHPDETINLDPEFCRQCHSPLEQVAEMDPCRRQVLDVPPIEMRVTEYVTSSKICACCGMINRGEFPEHVQAPVQYGPRFEAIAVYLMNYQLLPVDRTAQLLEDVLEQPVSVGTLLSFQSRCFQILKPIAEQIKTAIIEAKVAQFDETGFYINQRREWLHSASTPNLTYYAAHPKRGRKATSEIGILPNFCGTAMHDDFESYFGYSCQHGSCNAHHLRELTYIEEQFGQSWATSLKELLCGIKHAVEKAKAQGKDHFSRSTLFKFEQRYHQILENGFKINPPPKPDNDTLQRGSPRRGRQKQSSAKNLLDRLKKRSRETLRFMHDFQVPFDNNLAERDLRMMKVQQKISGCFRTEDGADHFCRIRSYISTARKQEVNVLRALQLAFLGSPFLLHLTT